MNSLRGSSLSSFHFLLGILAHPPRYSSTASGVDLMIASPGCHWSYSFLGISCIAHPGLFWRGSGKTPSSLYSADE